MSDFKCEVVRIKIDAHPNADQLELAKVGDYIAVVRKDRFVTGDLAVYIPEQAVVPEWLLREMGMWDEARQKGGLSGSLGNRVKAVGLRGVLSQGLVYSGNCGDEPHAALVMISKDCGGGVYCSAGYEEGEDVAEFLGITKYEPPLPSHMKGRAIGVDYDATHKYDFDNLKKTPKLFEDGEPVVITEKIHGTFMQVGVMPESKANDKYYKGRVIISSKGLGAKGIILDHNDKTNLYAQTAKKHGLLDKVLEHLGGVADAINQPVFLMGEVFGKTLSGAGVQDLTYADEPLDFRAFDICMGNRGNEIYAEFDKFKLNCEQMGVAIVPVLYEGPYSKEVVLQHTDGNTTLTDKKHIREGVVVKSVTESRNEHFGRKIAKSVSNEYLLRKGNATEFN